MKVPLLIPAFLLFAVISADSQSLSLTPIEGFRVPTFNDDGFREWDLRGDEAEYIESTGQVNVTSVVLRVYSGDEADRLEYEIESEEAVYDKSEQSIHGEQGIEIDGEGFYVEGEQWRYDTREDRIEISGNVHVSFEHALGDLLK